MAIGGLIIADRFAPCGGILTRLSKVSAFEVISCTSIMGYRDTEKRIPEIGEALARMGERDQAMHYAERMRDMTGPHMFYCTKWNPTLIM